MDRGWRGGATEGVGVGEQGATQGPHVLGAWASRYLRQAYQRREVPKVFFWGNIASMKKIFPQLLAQEKPTQSCPGGTHGSE